MDEREISLVTYFHVIAKRHRVIAWNCFAVTVLAIIISLVLPKKYTATATLLPPIEEEGISLLGSLMGGGALGAAAKLAGITGEAATPSDLMVQILMSRTVRSGVVKDCDLVTAFQAEDSGEAISILDDITVIEPTPEGIISISVKAGDPELVAQIVDAYIRHLDRFNRETMMTRGKHNRIFVEGRLHQVEDELEEAEDRLRAFQEVHKMVSLDEETIQAVQAAARLRGQVIAVEIKLGMLMDYSTEENPELVMVRRELRELKEQLSKMEFGDSSDNLDFGVGSAIPFSRLPEVAVELARLMRDVEILNAVYSLLTQEYEQAKIAEARDTPTVQVLDPAGVPKDPSFPRKKRIAVAAFGLSLLVGIGWAFLAEYAEKVKQRPEEYRQWCEIVDELKTSLPRRGKDKDTSEASSQADEL
jgi:tyrosine-protein kinase Etk/Wzc